MLLRGRHFETNELIDARCQDGRITSIRPAGKEPADSQAQWIAPSFFDLQINGCKGFGFSSESITGEQIREIVLECRRHGIGQFCPTLVTNSYEALHHGMTMLRQAMDSDLASAMPFIHLEGPYISPEEGPRGAHAVQFIRKPDWGEFSRLQEAAGGKIGLVTLAPELPGAIAFIEKLLQVNIRVAIGHSAANAEQIREAVAAGARLSTHLGNGAHAILPRHRNYIWEQLANDDLWASLISDGHHLPPSVVKCLVRGKTPSRVILTCDASSLAGMPAGKYCEWGTDLEILPEGKIMVAGASYLAGSWAFTDNCVGNLVRFAGVSLAEAILMATANPRAFFGLPERRLEEGYPADLILFDWEEGGDLRVRRTVCS